MPSLLRRSLTVSASRIRQPSIRISLDHTGLSEDNARNLDAAALLRGLVFAEVASSASLPLLGGRLTDNTYNNMQLGPANCSASLCKSMVKLRGSH